MNLNVDFHELDEKRHASAALPTPAQRRARRIAAGVTQEDLAKPLGVHRETVSRWERGERTPRGDLLVSYVRLLEHIS